VEFGWDIPHCFSWDPIPPAWTAYTNKIFSTLLTLLISVNDTVTLSTRSRQVYTSDTAECRSMGTAVIY
jgi:hypothetical protein